MFQSQQEKHHTYHNKELDDLVRFIKQDDGFRDYFNKFCCLPVFGQRVTFSKSGERFMLDPSPIRTQQRLSSYSQERVFRWLLHRRFEMFKRSRIALEYHLFLDLKEKRFPGLLRKFIYQNQ